MIKKLFVLVVLNLPAMTAQALTDEERTVLHQIRRDLLGVETLLSIAEKAVDTNHRHQFQYTQLQADIQAIRHGIEDAVARQRREPRSLPAIEGIY